MTSVPPGIDNAKRIMCHTSPPRGDLASSPLGHAVTPDAEALGELLPRKDGHLHEPRQALTEVLWEQLRVRGVYRVIPCAYVRIISTHQRSGTNGMWSASEASPETLRRSKYRIMWMGTSRWASGSSASARPSRV